MKSIREIALTPYYPYGRNKEKIIAERIFEIDEALDKRDSVIRADERTKTIEELRRFVDKHYENIVFELRSNGRIEDANRVLDKFAEQMKGKSENV